MNNLQSWDTSLETCGMARLSALMKALILTKSTMTCSFRLANDNTPLDARNSVWFRVNIPVDKESEFETISKCKLAKLPRIQVGMDTDPGFPYKGNFAQNL